MLFSNFIFFINPNVTTTHPQHPKTSNFELQKVVKYYAELNFFRLNFF